MNKVNTELVCIHKLKVVLKPVTLYSVSKNVCVCRKPCIIWQAIPHFVEFIFRFVGKSYLSLHFSDNMDHFPLDISDFLTSIHSPIVVRICKQAIVDENGPLS